MSPIHTLHILPGDRREPGEILEATLRREVLEKISWELDEPLRIGFRHIRHLTPRPPGYRYPYPSFLHGVYATPGLRCRPGLRKTDYYVQAARLVPVAEAHAVPLPPGQLAFLAAAQAALHHMPEVRSRQLYIDSDAQGRLAHLPGPICPVAELWRAVPAMGREDRRRRTTLVMPQRAL